LGILPEPYLTHFALLVEAAHILLGDNISLEELDMAEKMLDQFYKGFSLLYGESKCGINVHNLAHYAGVVRNWGPLWGYSCFSFEDLNGDCVDAVHGTRDIARQIFSAFFAVKRLEISLQVNQNISEASQKFVRKMLTTGRRPQNTTVVSDCQLAGKVTKYILKEELRIVLDEDLRDPSHTWLKALRIVLHGNVIYSAEYSRVQKRISYAVLWQDLQDDLSPALVLYFLHNENANVTVAVMESLIPMAAPPIFEDG